MGVPSSEEPIRVCHLASGDLWAGAEVQMHVQVAHLIHDPGLRVEAVLLNEGRLAETMRALGVPTRVIDESRLDPVAIFRELRRIFRDVPFHVLHTHKYKENVLGALAARMSGVRCLVRTLHGLPEPFTGFRALKMGLYRSLDAWVNRSWLTRVIAVSEQIRAHLDAPNVVLIHNGIDYDAVRDHHGSGQRDPSRLVIGSVGRLTAVKGHAALLEASARTMKALPERDIRVAIVGDGPLEESLAARARDLGIAERVDFLGHRDDVLDVMDAMDLVVFPSLHEGIPMALLEALALGKPVVATRVGGLPEVIEDRVNGVLVDPGDHAALSDACVSLIRETESAARLGRAGSATVRERFSAAQNASRVGNLYRELLRDGG